MKSIEKVIRQRHIKDIPVGMFTTGWGHSFFNHGLKDTNVKTPQKVKRVRRKHVSRGISRRINRDR